MLEEGPRDAEGAGVRWMMAWFSVQMLSQSLAQMEAGRGPWSPKASAMPLLLTVPLTFALLGYQSPPLPLSLD